MDVYLNGQMLPYTQATIRHDDAGLQHAVGLFETMTVHHSRPFALQAHIDRLIDSAATLGLSTTLDPDHLRNAVEQTITHNKLDTARIRLTVTPGSLSLLPNDTKGNNDTKVKGKNNGDTDNQHKLTILVVATELTVYDPAYFTRGIKVIIQGPAANPFDPAAGHKTLNYWPRLTTLRQAAHLGAGEAIWLNVTNHLASGAISNIFIVRHGQLFTPIARGEEQPNALRAPVLPGITRAHIIKLAKNAGLQVHRKMLSVEDLLDADEVFLTNSSWHVLPVTSIEKKTIAPPESTPGSPGSPGPITQQLRTALLQQIEFETHPTP